MIKQEFLTKVEEVHRTGAADLLADQEGKYQTLWGFAIGSPNWEMLEHRAPQYPFVQIDYALDRIYRIGIGIGMQESMPVNSVEIVTALDALTID